MNVLTDPFAYAFFPRALLVLVVAGVLLLLAGLLNALPDVDVIRSAIPGLGD